MSRCCRLQHARPDVLYRSMRLLNSRSRQLELLHHPPLHYAIVSHQWGDESEEVLFTDIGDPARTQGKEKGHEKIQGSCAQAEKDSLDYVWLDTCCIDKSNSAELSEAINSMYKWYQKSDVCYAYLHDVTDPDKFIESDWFSRGWTLQELIAPKQLKFFTKDWVFIDYRENLIGPISKRTGISPEILRSSKIPSDVTISQKMAWAACRRTSRVEDRAYSLLGILGVSMVPMYGIDDRAFENLQHEIVSKSADQTLFAWYHTIVPTQPDDVEMEDIGLTSEPSPHVAEPNPERDIEMVPAESNPSTPPTNTTGLLAPSPSQYLKSYEISESDFRKNYVDDIRDHSYRSHFSISNNLVHITVPMKHMEGDIWKAVLRCSLEPPMEGQIQRPLVIYLKEIQPRKYLRVHLSRNESEGAVVCDEVVTKGVPGSLEQLRESSLEGHVLQGIDVVAWHGESPSDDQPRLPPDGPGASSELTEDQRVAQLPRHPLGVKTTNIIVCGEPGAAAGRVINLIIGHTIIKPLTDYEREAMAATLIDATLQTRNIRIFYIIGPRDPYLDLETYYTAIRNVYKLVQQIKDAGGIHLVLLCMVGSRVTAAVETNYHLFYDYICDRKVPMMLIVTGLGKTKRMEDWWDKHSADRELQAMCSIDHACITVLQGEDGEHEKRYKDSTQTIQGLLVGFVENLEKTRTGVVYCPEDLDRWFVFIGMRAMDLLSRGQKKSLKQETIAKALKEAKTLKNTVGPNEWVDLTEEEAGDLARRFF